MQWEGVDHGQEGLLERSSWFGVLQILAAHEGESHRDLTSPLFDELEAKYPKTAWRNGRSFFRDYARMWTRLGVLRPTADTDGVVELTESGHAIVDDPGLLTEFFRNFIDNYSEVWVSEAGVVQVSPFQAVAGILHANPVITSAVLQALVEATVVVDLPEQTPGGFAKTANNSRRFRTYLRILENAEALVVALPEIAVLDTEYLRELAGGDSVSDTLLGSSLSVEDMDRDERELYLRTVRLREGQQGFKARLVAAYGGRCAVTGTSELGVLQGAHIMPYRGRHTNDVRNGLLLAADIHALFDAHLLGINPESLAVELNPSVTDERYAVLQGEAIRKPTDATLQPDSAALARNYAAFKRRLLL